LIGLGLILNLLNKTFIALLQIILVGITILYVQNFQEDRDSPLLIGELEAVRDEVKEYLLEPSLISKGFLNQLEILYVINLSN
jgi:hypothetical protein